MSPAILSDGLMGPGRIGVSDIFSACDSDSVIAGKGVPVVLFGWVPEAASVFPILGQETGCIGNDCTRRMRIPKT